MDADNIISSATILSRLSSLFSFRSSTEKKLLSWKQDESDRAWAKAAIRILVKTLKKHKGGVEDLLRALSHPDQQTKCITIPRSIDGRLQVATCKAVPHLIFCGIWRWTDLNSHHELEALNNCQFPFDAELIEVCINPYHYKRVDSPVLPPVFVPYYSLLDQDNTNVQIPTSLNYMGDIMTSEISDPSFSLNDESPPLAYSLTVKNEDLNFIDRCLARLTAIPYEEQPNWAAIAYYELNWRVGELFQCNTTKITVDGSANCNNVDRFCLGHLNSNTRTSRIDRVRNHIGKGIQFVYVCGKVYAENKSNVAIFIQSRNCNLYNGSNLNNVRKLSPAGSLCIFNYQYFGELLSASINYGFDSVWELAKMCTIRISFMKGWGTGYLLQDVISTPCWLEIHLSGPYNWLDRVTLKMDPQPK